MNILGLTSNELLMSSYFLFSVLASAGEMLLCCVTLLGVRLQAHQGGFGTGSTALTLASSIEPCLCSNDFLHFSVISQPWNNSPGGWLYHDLFVWLWIYICVEAASVGRIAFSLKSRAMEELQYLFLVTRGWLSLSNKNWNHLQSCSTRLKVRVLACFKN